MFNKLMKSVMFAGFAIFLAATVTAQSAQRYRATVEFDFSIQGERFAAGEYLIERSNPANGIGGLQITSVTTGKSRIFQAMIAASDNDRAANRLVFSRYGDLYFLRGIETPALTATLGRGRAESRLAKSRIPETVEVAVGRRAAR
jgi:hypothetical protein